MKKMFHSLLMVMAAMLLLGSFSTALAANGSKMAPNIARHAVLDGEWVYFSSKEPEPGIYRARLDGSSKTKIYDQFVYDLYLDDGKLYFFDFWGLYGFASVNIDGSGRKQIVSNSKTGAKMLKSVHNGYAYLFSQSENFVTDYIYRVRLDGKQLKKIITSNGITDLAFGHNKLMYATNESMLSIDLSTLKKSTYKIGSINHRAGSYCFDEKYIYYVSTTPNTGNYTEMWPQLRAIKRSTYDGKEQKLICITEKLVTRAVIDGFSTTSQNPRITHLTLDNGYLYYFKDHAGGDDELCRVNISSGVETTLANVKTYKGVYIVDGWVYYSDAQDNTYRIKSDGTGGLSKLPW